MQEYRPGREEQSWDGHAPSPLPPFPPSPLPPFPLPPNFRRVFSFTFLSKIKQKYAQIVGDGFLFINGQLINYNELGKEEKLVPFYRYILDESLFDYVFHFVQFFVFMVIMGIQV